MALDAEEQERLALNEDKAVIVDRGGGKDERDARVIKPNANATRRRLLPFALFGVLILVLSLIFGFVFVLHESESGANPCLSNDFELFNYSRSSDGSIFSLGLKFVEKGVDELYNYEEALSACRSMDSELWQVREGQDEWEAVFQLARSRGKELMWIDVKPDQICPQGVNAICRVDEALLGRGLRVRRSQTAPQYSRLVGGGKDVCLQVWNSGGHKYVWRRVQCTSRFYALCVKRNCYAPNAVVEPFDHTLAIGAKTIH